MPSRKPQRKMQRRAPRTLRAPAPPPQPAATGFDPAFLPGHTLKLPKTTRPSISKDYAPTKTGELVRNYTHYSLAMSASRRFCRWVAWNIDGTTMHKLPRVDMKFRLDVAYEPKYQVGEELYTEPANALDRGHIARRADLIWGTDEEAAQGNIDSFFFTNITPQLSDFNRSSSHGLWGELENAVSEEIKIDSLRMSVFGGPIFKDDDFQYRKTLIPRSFWKVIAYVQDGQLQAKAYTLTQDDLENKLALTPLDPFKLYELSLAELKQSTGLTFPGIAAAEPPARRALAAEVLPRLITTRSQIVAS
jgi:endonuclease G